MEKNTEIYRIKKSIKKIVEEILYENPDFVSCFRLYPAKVTIAPNQVSKRCSVHLVSQTTDLSIPYSSDCSDVNVGEMVWVATVSNSFSTAIVWAKYDFS